MTATATYHDIEPYTVKVNRMASARCLTHQTDTTEQWHDTRAAARGFVCDEGRSLRFIIETETDDTAPVPVMRDLTGLARAVRASAEIRAYCGYDSRTTAWLWLGDGQTERLEIALDRASEFDSDDYATETWTVTGADGRVIASVPVRIDGRA